MGKTFHKFVIYQHHKKSTSSNTPAKSVMGLLNMIFDPTHPLVGEFELLSSAECLGAGQMDNKNPFCHFFHYFLNEGPLCFSYIQPVILCCVFIFIGIYLYACHWQHHNLPWR